MGAAVPRGPEHAAGARIGGRLRARAARCARRRPRTTATSSFRPSTCRRAFRMPRRRSSPRAAATCAAAPRSARSTRRATPSRSRSGQAWSDSPPPSSPSVRISSRHASVPGPPAEPRGARRSRGSRRSRTNRSRRSTFGFAGPVPFAAPMLRLDDAPGQWVFDRSDAAVRTCGNRGHEPRGRRDQRQRTARRARPGDARARGRGAAAPPRARPAAGRPVARDRRAPRDVRLHAGTRRARREAALARGVYLAGDYTDPEFPATLEAATRSGVAAARALIADCAGAAAARGSTRAP